MSNPLNLNAVQESQLFTTSLASDVQVSGGYLKIGNMSKAKLSNISQMIQTKYRAETVQVVTVTTTYTPAGNTTYAIEFGDTLRTRGGLQETLKRVSVTTVADVTTYGATAALQREAINALLITEINNFTGSYYVTAATSTLGAGFTITDSAGYYPTNAQGMTNRLGATYVKTCRNSDGTGFSGSEAAVTTAAVYSFGVGADLAAWSPVIDQMWGNLISGYTGGTCPRVDNDPTGAVATSGQKYDGFAVISLTEAPIPTSIGRSQTAYIPKVQIAYCDNGTGTATTNLTGFKAAERAFHKVIVSLYANDPCTTQEWFDRPIVFQDPLAAVPSGTADILGWQLSPYTSLNRTNIGTQTIVVPVLDDTGLLLDQDDTGNDGSHTSANQQALSDCSFIVGKTAFSVVARVVAGDWTDTFFMVGFRKKAVYTANFDNYTDLASIGGALADGDSITTHGILNNAATVATDSGVNFVDATSMLLRIDVALNGTVSAYYASATGGWVSAAIYSVGTTTLVFDAGDEMIPFYQHVNIGGGNPAVSIGEFFAINATDAFPVN